MTAAKTDPSDFRMSGKEFDRIMGQALRVKPKTAKKVVAKKAKTIKSRRRKPSR